MFDIGFWEIVVIAVVALLVVGPNEFPTLVRNIGRWLGKIRSFVSETKSDLDREFRKADELKQLLTKEAELARLHEQVDARTIKPVNDESKSSAQRVSSIGTTDTNKAGTDSVEFSNAESNAESNNAQSNIEQQSRRRTAEDGPAE